MKKMKGFTLIELIVVIAIIGVLAAILIPSLAGYISDSRTSTANANAKLAFQNAATWMTKVQIAGATGLSNTTSGVLDLRVGGATGNTKPTALATIGTSVDSTDLESALQFYMGGVNAGVCDIEFDVGQNPIGAVWAATELATVTGAYPVAVSVQTGTTLQANSTTLLTYATGEAVQP